MIRCQWDKDAHCNLTFDHLCSVFVLSTSLNLESQKNVAYSCRNHMQAPFVGLMTRLAGLRFKNQTGPEKSLLRTLQVPFIFDSDGLWLTFMSISTYSISHRSSSEKYPTEIEAQSRQVKTFLLNI